MTFDVTESGVAVLKNLALWGFVTSGGQRIGITFWATRARVVSRISSRPVLWFPSDQQLVAGVEAATREKQSTALGTTLDPATHVMRSTRRSAAVRAVSIAVVHSSEIRFAVQKKHRLYATGPRASKTPTDIAGSAWSLRTRVLHFARASLDQLIRPHGQSAVLARCSTTAAGVRKPSRVNSGCTTPKA